MRRGSLRSRFVLCLMDFGEMLPRGLLRNNSFHTDIRRAMPSALWVVIFAVIQGIDDGIINPIGANDLQAFVELQDQLSITFRCLRQDEMVSAFLQDGF